MVWVLLFITGMLEVVWATAAGYSEGFTKLGPSLVVLAVMPVTFYLLSIVMRHLPAGTAYAIWTSIGTAGTALLGILAFGDPANSVRLGGLALVIAGVVILRIADGRGQPEGKKEKAGA
jgi:quaternary ammonium compound-resistance protein SugE